MNKIFFKVYVIILLALTSCSTEPIEEAIDSKYKLASWTVNLPVDLNNDGISSLNLLDEITCSNDEVLVFNTQGNVLSNNAFNPEISIVFDKFTKNYQFNVECDVEGNIGLAANYTLSGDKIIFNNNMATIKGDKLIMIFKKAVNVYSKDFTQVLEEKDLTLVYHKQ
ncbi:hypothetical protein KO566_06565 [Flavobacteriaceae bacterium XHP0103]|uniref:hypothetical protein n=1 Tax=Marixanthotalea marina TaxID=2844359 RepID=UPI0029899FEA|nr:hypothetical protein [Marixanthotalea marina]MBU3821717.1 hypothetical protein [Marixanthotalea marina]